MTETSELNEAVRARCDEVEGRVAVSARHLDTDETIDIAADRSQPTGSAAKALVLARYAEAVASGGLDPAERLTVTEESLNRQGSGVLRFLAPGLEPTVNDCAWLMMTISDNVATDLVLDHLGGPGPVNDLMDRLDLGEARITSPSVWVMPPEQFGTATPQDLAGLYAVFADPEAHGYPPQAADRAREILLRHQQPNCFARHLPFSAMAMDFGITPGVRIWSKTGSYPSVQVEAGLFATEHARWVLAVMADGLTDWRANALGTGQRLLADVAELVHRAWAGS